MLFRSNLTTDILVLNFGPKEYQAVTNSDSLWAGIIAPMFIGEYDQTRTKFFEIWLRGDAGKLTIDLGKISEDYDGNGILNNEDIPDAGLALGNGFLEDNEDTGLDGCFDAFEDGWGSCLDSSGSNYQDYLSSGESVLINASLDVNALVVKTTMPSVLEKAHNDETDMIIAVTKNDETNMLICQIAYSLFKIPKKIARIRSQDYLNPKFAKIYNKENLPIDVIISPELEIAKSIQRKLEAPGALDNVPFADNKIRLLEILIDEKCPIVNIQLNELTKKFPKLEANILGVVRNEKFIFLKKK